jgi:hypothetical protein
MIPVAEQPEPELPIYDFHHDVYERGEDAIRQLAGLAPLRTWKGPRIHARVTRTEDVRNAADPMLAYRWSNWRLAHALVNSVKSAIPEVLDPFAIGQGWFAIDFGTFETVVGPQAPDEQRGAIQRTIEALKLDGRELATTRRRAAERYWSPPIGHRPIPLWSLEQDEPFLAGELRRQGRLNPEDT